MKFKFTILLCLAACTGLSGQQITKVNTIRLPHKVVDASVDRQGNIYLASDNGDVDRFDSSGELSYHFSPDIKGNVSLIEAWQGLRVIVFYRDFQQYQFLDRFLIPSVRYNIGNDQSRYYQWATIAGDNNLWLIDQQELSLIKLDIALNEFLIETFLNLNLDPDNFELTYIREYQNLLFLADKNSGVLVFDNLGNYMDTLPITGVDHFSFSGNQLLALTSTGLKLIDIYSKKQNTLSLPPGLKYEFALKTGQHLYMAGGDRLDIYKVNSP